MLFKVILPYLSNPSHSNAILEFSTEKYMFLYINKSEASQLAEGSLNREVKA